MPERRMLHALRSIPRAAVLVVSVALVPRLFLLALPGLGRDEAAYLYWGFHPEPTYAPLLTGLLRASAALPGPLTLTARLPGLLVGLVGLALLWSWLRSREQVPLAGAFAAVAWTPWCTLTGALVHPDALLLAAVLAFATFDRRRHRLGLCVAALAATLAKPSGALLLLVAAAWWWRWRDRGHGLASASCLVTGLAILTWFSPSMLSGLTQFARMEDGVSWPTRLLVGTISALALGGFALPTVGLLGLVRRGPWTASRWGGTAFVVAFGLAALLTGQVKGNWALPGLLLLWPHGGPGWPRPVWTGLASVSLALTLITTAALVRPDWTGDLEARLPVLSRLYAEQAGAREARVSPTRSWAHRFGEYRGLEPFAEEVRKLAPQPLGWIVCDDYGLATQLSVALSRARIPVVLPQDPIFRRTVRQGEPARPADGILYVGVHRTPAELAAALDHPWPLRPLEALPHPVTGDPLQLATPTGATP